MSMTEQTRTNRAVTQAAVLCAVVVSLLLTGCAARSNFVASGAAGKLRQPVAVVPFDNLSGHPEAGEIVADLFQDELYEVRGADLEVVSPEKVASLAEKLEPHQHSPAKLGELLGAGAVVVGRVNEFAYKHVLGEDPAVSISVRLVDVETGDVLWNAALSRTGRCSWLKQDSLGRLTHDMCHEMARWLSNALKPGA